MNTSSTKAPATHGNHEPLRPEQMKRSDIILLLIEEGCAPTRDYPDGLPWIPSAYPVGVHCLTRPGEPLYTVELYGAGDMAALKSLVRKGYIREDREQRGFYWITDEGKLRAQELA
jgi:hypothetical protein